MIDASSEALWPESLVDFITVIFDPSFLMGGSLRRKTDDVEFPSASKEEEVELPSAESFFGVWAVLFEGVRANNFGFAIVNAS